MDFLELFLIVLACPILPPLICGLAVFLFEKLFLRMTGGFGRGLVYATAIIGTPIHELSHAMMCIPFLHKIDKICLWSPKAPNGVFGYVEHSYKKKNPWHVLGNLFIGVAPIIGGLGVTTLIMRICFPETLSSYYSTALSVTGIADIPKTLLGCIKMIPSMFTEASVPIYARIIGGVLMLAVCLHINLSPEDIKSSLTAFPIYAFICLILSTLFYLIGGETSAAFRSALILWVYFTVSLFMVVFASCLILLALGAIIYIIGRIFKK